MRLSQIWRAWKWIREGGRLADESGLRGAERSAFVQGYANEKFDAWERQGAERSLRASLQGARAALESPDDEGDA